MVCITPYFFIAEPLGQTSLLIMLPRPIISPSNFVYHLSQTILSGDTGFIVDVSTTEDKAYEKTKQKTKQRFPSNGSRLFDQDHIILPFFASGRNCQRPHLVSNMPHTQASRTQSARTSHAFAEVSPLGFPEVSIPVTEPNPCSLKQE